MYNKIVLFIILLICLFFFVPVKKVFLADEIIYGKTFKNTYNGVPVSTEGHYTLKRVSLYVLVKYKGQYKEVQE